MHIIREMEELILCRQLYFLNTVTCDFDYHPAEMDFFPDEKNPWHEVIDKVDNICDDYILIEPMNSNQSYAVLELFADQLKSNEYGEKLIAALNRPKPFNNFDYLIHESDFKQEWFDFRKERNVEWVREQIYERMEV